MSTSSGAAEYFAPQLEGPVPLQDVLELRSATEFFLRGRDADMIKVAGKRASLQELTRQILEVPGVEDAVVFLPDADATTRPPRSWRPVSPQTRSSANCAPISMACSFRGR